MVLGAGQQVGVEGEPSAAFVRALGHRVGVRL